MSIFHTNIRRSAKDLSPLKRYLGALEFYFSIIGISENWGARENINVQTIPGYSYERCIRRNGKRGGCVSIFVKKVFIPQN